MDSAGMSRIRNLILSIILLTLVSGCTTANATPTPTATSTPLPTNTLQPTATPLPTLTATVTYTPPPPATQIAQAQATQVAGIATQKAFATILFVTENAIYSAQTAQVITQMAAYVEIDPQELTANTGHYLGTLVKVKVTIASIVNDQELEGVMGGTDGSETRPYILVDMSDSISGLGVNSVITVYGTVAGTQCNPNAAGQQVCLPWLISAFYEK